MTSWVGEMDGVTARQITNNGGFGAQESPDGAMLLS